MEFRTYTPGDLANLIADDGLRAIVSDQYVDPRLSWTLFDRKVIACGGFATMWPGVYEAWVHVSSYSIFVSYKVCLIKKIRQEIDRLNYHRLQAAVDINTPNHAKFMKLLGFNAEGNLTKYGLNQQDYIMYARTQ